jgi:nucleotide-binding universal stress UspA family protein/organic hydroperoxide reductase OsmC/OhrA
MTSGGRPERRAAFLHIACCIDRSAASERALAEAARLWRLGSGRFSVVHVASPPFVSGYSRWGPEYQPFYAEAEEWLRTRVADLPGAEAVLLWGFAGERVAEWAAEAEPDLLVAAAYHGRARRMLGSFTGYLARHAPCSVLVVRPEEPGAIEAGRRQIATTIDSTGRMRPDGGAPSRPGQDWRPEHLLLAAVAPSALDSLVHQAALAGLEAHGGAAASGALVNDEAAPPIEDIACRVEASIRPARAIAEIERLTAEAERGCRLGAALAAPPRYEWVVNGRLVEP